jgi:hypothetical protein
LAPRCRPAPESSPNTLCFLGAHALGSADALASRETRARRISTGLDAAAFGRVLGRFEALAWDEVTEAGGAW